MRASQIIFAVFLLLLTTLAGYFIKQRLYQNRPALQSTNQVRVTTSFYPLYFFASRIGSESVVVSNLTPAGAEPHDFDPSPADIARITASRLFIINGEGFEPWAERLLPSLPTTVSVIQTAAGLANLEIEDEGEVIRDPHVWLDPLLAQQQAAAILAGFLEVDPVHASLYTANANRLRNQLQELHQEFETGLASCRKRTIITSHDAFGYLAARYNLKVLSLAGLSPEAEPSPRQIADLTDFARRNDLAYIFFETLVSPKLAQTLATEVGAQTLVFNPLEGLTPEEVATGADYFSIQRQNLAHLKLALNCN